VCFGKEGWPHFKEIFGVVEHELTILAPGIHIYDAKRIVLCPFFAYGHMSGEMIRIVAQKFRDWRVKIP
jgi:hypothetical protein